jgi:DNA-binding beta-propeller fold protein YncE
VRIDRRQFFVVSGSLVATSCYSGRVSSGPVLAWGREGWRDGSFIRPRAIGVHRGEVYVIDVTGRVQVFDAAGEFLRMWRLPAFEGGTPTAVAFRPGGQVVIPDTHYSRILEYTAAGELGMEWGQYGAAPGAFIYPTGLTLDGEGTHFISEYGSDFNPETRIEAERVQVFDAGRGFVRQWGRHGDAPGEFSRAMAIALTPGGMLVVADTANHRLQLFERDGTFVRSLGRPGSAPGALNFPHDVTVAPDGTILTCEYGTHRISRFTLEGRFVGAFGGAGRGPGQFNAPRGVACDLNGVVFVADTDNHRIQRIPLEAVA